MLETIWDPASQQPTINLHPGTYTGLVTGDWCCRGGGSHATSGQSSVTATGGSGPASLWPGGCGDTGPSLVAAAEDLHGITSRCGTGGQLDTLSTSPKSDGFHRQKCYHWQKYTPTGICTLMNEASLNSMKKLVFSRKSLSKCQYLAKIMHKLLDSEILEPTCWLSWTKQKLWCWLQLNWRWNICPCRYCLFGDFLLHYFPFCPPPQLARVVLVAGSRCVSVTATIVQTSWCRGSSWHPSSCPALPLPAQTSRSPSRTDTVKWIPAIHGDCCPSSHRSGDENKKQSFNGSSSTSSKQCPGWNKKLPPKQPRLPKSSFLFIAC